jgi:WD40 repeat protein
MSNLQSSESVRVFGGPNLSSVVLTRDGQGIVSAGSKGVLTLWSNGADPLTGNLGSPERLGESDPLSSAVVALTATAAGIAAGTAAGSVSVVGIAPGSHQYQQQQHQQQHHHHLHQRHHLVTAGTWKHPAAIVALDTLRDGTHQTVLSFAEDGSAAAADLAGRVLWGPAQCEPGGSLDAAAASGPSTFIAVGSGSIREWDVRAGTCQGVVRNALGPASGSGPGSGFGAGAGAGASGGLPDSAARFARSVAVHPGQPYILAIGDSEGSVHFWDLRKPASLAVIQSHAGAVTALKFHPAQNNTLVTASHDGAVQWFSFDEASGSAWGTNRRDAAAGGTFAPRGFQGEGAFSVYNVHQEAFPIHSVDLSASGLLASGSDSNLIAVRKITNAAPQASFF